MVTIRHYLEVYMDEEKKLKAFIEKKCLKVSFTTNRWTSIQKVNYMVLIAHFIDDNWILQITEFNFFCAIHTYCVSACTSLRYSRIMTLCFLSAIL